MLHHVAGFLGSYFRDGKTQCTRHNEKRNRLRRDYKLVANVGNEQNISLDESSHHLCDKQLRKYQADRVRRLSFVRESMAVSSSE